jgi:hypothetical protein
MGAPPTTPFLIILDSAHRPLPPSKKMARRRGRAKTGPAPPKNTIRLCRYEYMNRRTALYHARWSPVCAVIRTQMIVYAHVHRHPVRVGNLPRCAVHRCTSTCNQHFAQRLSRFQATKKLRTVTTVLKKIEKPHGFQPYRHGVHACTPSSVHLETSPGALYIAVHRCTSVYTCSLESRLLV